MGVCQALEKTYYSLILGVYFIDNPIIWLVSRFLCGTIYLAQSTSKNVWQVEITSGIWRSRIQNWGHEIPLQLGILVLGGLIYLLPGKDDTAMLFRNGTLTK